jgi:hypothetical protein
MAVKHKIRDKKGALVEVNLTPIRAIRKFCVECMVFRADQIDRCIAKHCPLYPFRSGNALTGLSGNVDNLPPRTPNQG